MVIEKANFCTLNGVGCPTFGILPCGTSLPTPTPTPTPAFTCPSTDPANCQTGIAKDPCRDPIGDGCPPFMHPEGACCVRDQCFYPPDTCGPGEVVMRFPAPFCTQICVPVFNLPQPTCQDFSFIWGSLAGFCRATVPTSQTDCDGFSWFWNPISDFCQEDGLPHATSFPRFATLVGGIPSCCEVRIDSPSPQKESAPRPSSTPVCSPPRSLMTKAELV